QPCVSSSLLGPTSGHRTLKQAGLNHGEHARIVVGIGRNHRPPEDEAQWWRLEVPGSEDVVEETDESLGTWTFPDGYEEDLWPSTFMITRVPAPGLPPMMSLIDPPKCWHVDVLMVGRPTPNERWEELTQPGQHVNPDRSRPATPDEQAADDKRVLEIRERTGN
ncbi:hypothetical protein, partial [Mycolicibacterium brisbanense]